MRPSGADERGAPATGDPRRSSSRAISSSGDVRPTLHALELAKVADTQGYDGIYVSDHMFFPRDRQSRSTVLDPRGRRPRVRRPLGPRHPLARSVVPDLGHGGGDRASAVHHGRLHRPPVRDVITVAKQVGTAVVVSSGRVALGIGVGWCEEEFRGHRTGLPHPASGSTT